MLQYRKPKAKSEMFYESEQLRLQSFYFERSAPIPVCVYAYSSSNLEDAHLQKHSTANLRLLVRTEEDLTRTKCTYGGATLRMKHCYCHEYLPSERTYSGDTLRSAKCIYGYRPTQFRRSTTMTMMISEHKYYGQSKFTYPMNDLRLQLL